MDPQFEQLCASYTRRLSGLSTADVERHPGGEAGRWNARQIVEHLRLTYRRSGALFRERLDKGRPTQARATNRQQVSQFLLLTLGYFPNGRQAPEFVIPAAMANPLLDGPAVGALFRSELVAMEQLLVECEKLFGGRKFATHQILGPLNADQWRRFHVVHARHHLQQLNSAG